MKRTPTLQFILLSIRTSGWVSLILVLLFLLTFCISCDTDPDDEDKSSEPLVSHVAMAGGGWRAHTGHAGWTMSLLDGGNKKLSDVFSNVSTISSNSGGSWFSTMLMYSEDFVTAIEAPNAISTWDTIGWLGKQKMLFDEAPCHDVSGGPFDACVANHYAPGLFGGFYWDLVVQDLIFKDYPIDTNVTLSGARQTWAEDKPLLLAATMLTTEVVLNESSGDKRYYEACLSPSTPILNGDNGASCSGEAIPDVTPVTFSSIPSSSNFMTPPFLPAAGLDTASSMFNVGYTENKEGASTASTSIQNSLANDQVPVVIAAAASSAAAGFEASHVVSKSWYESYMTEDEALSFQLANSKVEFVNAKGMSTQDLADKKMVQIADGGPVDNSGVAQLVSFLQLNNQAEGFNIVAFDNVQALYSPGGNAADVGTDIAYLFGKGLSNGNQFCSGLNGTGTCITVPDLQIFDLASLTSTEVTWSADASPDSTDLVQKLIYTKYTVTTVANPTFGISAGSTGTLHAFTCAWSDAHTAPQNKPKRQDKDFIAYSKMLSFINSGLQEQNAQGLKYLEAALGINP